jgi:hypothetical protein
MTTDTDAATVSPRSLHKVVEPLHTLLYFVPEARERYAEAGINGGMRAYFASRSAAFGQVPADVVVATFYNFSPAIVAKAIPSVWETTTPEQVLAARLDIVDAALTRMLGSDVLRSDELAEAAALAREAAEAASTEIVGRPLFAAHVSLPWPEPAHLQLWHATTLLREHRGDGHIAALVLSGLSGPQAVVSYTAYGTGLPEDIMRHTRGYTEDEWAATKAELRDKGIFDADDHYTAEGREQRERIEAQTDAAAATPYERLGPERSRRLAELLRPWARSVTKQIFG